jgi:hypothetical protein
MDEFSLARELLGFFEKGQISALLVVILAILATTQIVKVTITRLSAKPTVREIHLTSLASALLFGWFLWPAEAPIQKVLAIVLGWGGAAVLATYGLKFLAEFFPRLHRVLQMDRRKEDAGPPDGSPDRRQP